jgi:APA family basic amino acid/polyamine antiporter
MMSDQNRVAEDPHRLANSKEGVVGFRLPERLSLADGTALVVSNVIGVGIFITPAVIASLVHSPAAVLVLWMVGGLLAFAGAVTYSELAKLCPEAGGEYNYLSQAFGPLAGFLTGWTSLIAGFSGAIAASSVALVSYAGHYFPSQTSTLPVASVSLGMVNLSLSRQSLLASAVILIFAMIHVLGLGPGRVAQKTLASLVVLAIVVLILSGFLWGRGSWAHFHGVSGHVGATDWLLALIPVMFAYSGWNAAAYVSEEMRGSGRAVGPALVLGTGIVLVLYVALNVLFFFALPLPEMATAINVGEAAGERLFGVTGGLLTPILLIAFLGTISAMTIAGPRVYFAMARDGVFLKPFRRISRRFETPALAILLQAGCSVVLVLLGEFEQILIYTGFAIMLSSGASVTALYVIRHRRGLRGHPFRTLVIPALFALASALMIGNAIYRAPGPSLVGLLLIAAGVPLFIFSRRREASRAVASPPTPDAAMDHEG